MLLLIVHLLYHLAFVAMEEGTYDQRVHDVGMGYFSPLVFSAAGDCGPTHCHPSG